MGVFDEIKEAGSAAGSALTEGATKVGKLAQAEIEKRKLKSLQDDVASAQQEMGALAYDLVGSGELSHPQLEAGQTKISEALALVADKESEIAALKAEAKQDAEPSLEAEEGESPSDSETSQEPE